VGSWNGSKTIAFRNQKSWILSLRTEQEKRPQLDPWNMRERTRKSESFVRPRPGKESPSSPRMVGAPSLHSQEIMQGSQKMSYLVDAPCLFSQEIMSGPQQRDAVQVPEISYGSTSTAVAPEPKRSSGMGETLCFWNTWEASTPRSRAGPRWKVFEGEPVLHPAQGSFQIRRSPRKSPRKQDQYSTAGDADTIGPEGVEMASQTSKSRPRIRTWGSLARAEAAAEASLAAQEAAEKGFAAIPASGAALDSQVLLRSKERLKRMVGLGQTSLLRQEMKQSLSSNRGKLDQQLPEKNWKHSKQTLMHAGTHAMSAIKAMAAQRNELQKMRKKLEEMHVEKKTSRMMSTFDSLSARFQQTRGVRPTPVIVEDA